MNIKVKRIMRNIAIVVLLYVVGMAAVYGLDVFGVSTLVVFPVFILGILIASLESDSGAWGAILGVCYLLSYDFLFTTPLYHLKIMSRSEIIALLLFLLVALIMSTVTHRMRTQVEVAERNALIMNHLNKLSSGLIDSRSSQGACTYTQEFLTKALGRNVELILGSPSSESQQALIDCYEQNIVAGYGTPGYHGCTVRCLPLSTRGTVYGVAVIDCSQGSLDSGVQSFISSVLSQTVVAIERNELEEAHRKAKVREEGERFKTVLLQSVSHDLRTPLTSITGNAELLLEGPVIDQENSPETAHELLQEIRDDSLWLNDMVENLLSMTRMQDDSIQLEKNFELVDEIIGDAIIHEERQRKEHELDTELPQDLLLVPMDGRLISQVLINLIDNAFKHSAPTSKVIVRAYQHDDDAVFEVEDNGGGIPEDELEHIFSNFYTGKHPDGARKGMGLGLSICKAIVEAHDGEICAFNNEQSGATFRFTLPLDTQTSTGDDLS